MNRDVDVERVLKALGIDARLDGQEWWACCPLGGHDEQEASWSIHDEPGAETHGLQRCFGCERGGTATDLVMARVGITFKSAQRWLEERNLYDDSPALNFELRMPPKRGQFQLPAGVVFGPAAGWDRDAWGYAEGRGITARQVDRWGIGYALRGELAGRIVFPVRAASGAVGSYMARAFDGRQPRYLTPPLEASPDQNIVWGEHRWPALEQRAARVLVVCEGAINALACERAGAQNLAALGGSHLSPVVVAKLQTFGALVFAVDVDSAGNRVAADLFAAYARWRKVRRVQFPPKVDPADMMTEELRRALWAP